MILDKARFLKNVQRLNERIPKAVSLRPHLKTIKCFEAASRVLPSPKGPATISTLAEAEYFGERGVTDLLYSVCITPQKLDRVSSIRQSGIDLKVVIDSLPAAKALSEYAHRTGDRIPVLIEVDVDGHRSGVGQDQPELVIAIAKVLCQGGCDLQGVMAHAGESYGLSDSAMLEAAARNERDQAVQMAQSLRAAGNAARVVSIGSTPTAFSLNSFHGITEVRAGVYMLFDLVQNGIGVCQLDDIAISVLATVIGHKATAGWTIVDAGWMALSMDRGTARQTVDQHFGLVCDINCKPIHDLVLLRVSQEHGLIAPRPGTATASTRLSIGDRVRILPNHACATSAQHEQYGVIDGNRDIIDIWPRFRGW